MDPNQDQYYEQDTHSEPQPTHTTSNPPNANAHRSTASNAATSAPTTTAATQPPTKSSSGSAQFRTAPSAIKAEQSKRAEQNQNSTAKIDERNIPRVNISNALKRYECRPNADVLPPSSREQYIARDCGNATPRHVRLTLYNVPVDQDIAAKSQLAMGAIFQPFANPGIGEAAIPLVDAGEGGPLRCSNCRSYMNPHVLWFADGTKWSCNLCHIVNDCPQDYRANLDGKYQRRDRMQRPELHRGSVDYVAPKKMVESWAPQEPAFFFVIDVSCIAFRRDLVTLTVEAIRETLVDLRQQIRAEYEQRSGVDDGKFSEDRPPTLSPNCDCVFSAYLVLSL